VLGPRACVCLDRRKPAPRCRHPNTRLADRRRLRRPTARAAGCRFSCSDGGASEHGRETLADREGSFDPSLASRCRWQSDPHPRERNRWTRNTSSGTELADEFGDVSRAPVRSSARSFKEGMQLAGYHVPKEAAYNVTIVQSRCLRSYRGLEAARDAAVIKANGPLNSFQ